MIRTCYHSKNYYFGGELLPYWYSKWGSICFAVTLGWCSGTGVQSCLKCLLAGGSLRYIWPNDIFIAFPGFDDLTVQTGQLPTMTGLFIRESRCDNQSGNVFVLFSERKVLDKPTGKLTDTLWACPTLTFRGLKYMARHFKFTPLACCLLDDNQETQ